MAEWVWNGGRHCWDSDASSIYRTKDGGFVIADEGGWLPGAYDSREAAELAFERDAAFLQALQERKNEGAWGADRLITLADLTEEGGL